MSASIPQSRSSTPFRGNSRPRIVSSQDIGCSWISLSMKWRKPPFSAIVRSHEIVTGAFSSFLPARLKKVTPSRFITAISPSSRNTALRVCARNAGMSEARNVSPSPSPMINGDAVFAAMITFGACAHSTEIA